MQKVKNVKSIYTLILLIGSVLLGFSQEKLSGTYYLPDPMGDFSFSYTFFDNGIFTHEVAGDVAISSYGKGHYEITKDSLILNFDLTEIIPKGYYIARSY